MTRSAAAGQPDTVAHPDRQDPQVQVAQTAPAAQATQAAQGAQPTPRVRLLTRPGCHLCEVARAYIAAVCSELGVGWTEVDVTTDPALLQAYAEQIPVTFVDGAQHDFWHVDPVRLRAALS